jgi:hypothetical protein
MQSTQDVTLQSTQDVTLQSTQDVTLVQACQCKYQYHVCAGLHAYQCKYQYHVCVQACHKLTTLLYPR